MKKKKSMLNISILVALITIVSKLLGFVREALIAAFFGATASTDALFFAQSMPEMIFPSVCNGISTAFISIYIAKKAHDERQGSDYASRMVVFTLFIGVVLALFGTILAPILVQILAPGFSGEQIQLTTTLTRLTMSAFVLIMIQYMGIAILNSNKIFVKAHIIGLLQNVVIICVTFFMGRNQSMVELERTFILGQIIYILGLTALVGKNKYLTRPSQWVVKSEIKEIVKLSLPILIGNAAIQINTIVDKMLGSTLPSGSVSALSYSHTLCNIVTGVFIASLSTVLYPTLADYIAKNEKERFASSLTESLNGLSLILIPISITVLACNREIVSFVFERGSFDAEASKFTSYALAFYSPMFVFFGIREVISRAFFSMKETKIPMINTSIGVAVNVCASIILSRYLGIGGIALGTSISSMVIALLFLYSLKKKANYISFKAFGKNLISQSIAGLVAFVSGRVLGYYVDAPAVVLLFAKTALIVLVYIGIILMINKQLRVTIINFLMKGFHMHPFGDKKIQADSEVKQSNE